MLAEQEGTNRQCALKMVYFDCEKSAQDCFREVQSMRKVKHENTVEFIDFFIMEREDSVGDLQMLEIYGCIVMEYCEGGDLQQQMEAAQRKKQYFSEEVNFNSEILTL